MEKYKLKCSTCGYVKMSSYMHDVCPKCNGSMHFGDETSLFEAISNKDTKLIREIERRAKSGQVVRIM